MVGGHMGKDQENADTSEDVQRKRNHHEEDEAPGPAAYLQRFGSHYRNEGSDTSAAAAAYRDVRCSGECHGDTCRESAAAAAAASPSSH